MTDTMPDDDCGSPFVPGRRARAAPTGSGALDGLSFAAKDMFDVAGAVTTFGHPDWARTHGPAVATAPLVRAMLDAGATLAGKTKTVEFAFGLTGENTWQGTPVNPAAPGRLPGGSSCGSAAAVAGGHVDVALGTDTGGSVRIPASYCGVFGFRPTHGALSLAGVRALAPSLDTAGWFARGTSVFARAGDVLLPGLGMAGAGMAGTLGPLLRPDVLWFNAALDVADVLSRALETIAGAFGGTTDVQVAPEGLDPVYHAMRVVQAEEVWATLGDWVSVERPRCGPAIAERFAAAEALDPEEARAARAFRRTLRGRLAPLLDGGAVLAFPTSPCPAPLLNSDSETLDSVRAATMGATALASLCGLPEATIPAGRVDGAPVGLSFLAGAGRDRALLDFACRAAAVLGLPE